MARSTAGRAGKGYGKRNCTDDHKGYGRGYGRGDGKGNTRFVFGENSVGSSDI